jgi:SAM-dependent methyltransferase
LYSADYFTSDASEYGDYVGEEPAHRRQARRYLRSIARVHATGSLLDVGGATGFFADEARKAGWQVELVEVSTYAANHAREALGLPVVIGAFPSVTLHRSSFDVVTFFNVFEHLNAPREAETRLRNIVPPGGVVAIETWDWGSMLARTLGLEWHQYQPAYVPCYYNRKSLLALFQPDSWECLTYGSGTKWISLRRATEILAAKHGARMLKVLGDSALGSVDLPYRLGDLIWVVFRRRTAQAAMHG